MRSIIYVKEMDCPVEVKEIEDKFDKIDGIYDTHFDTEKRIIKVEHKKSLEEKLLKAITSLGYHPKLQNDIPKTETETETNKSDNVEVCESCNCKSESTPKLKSPKKQVNEKNIYNKNIYNRIKGILPLILSFIFFISGILIQTAAGYKYIALPVYLIGAIIGGYKVFYKAFFSLKNLNLNMNVLMTVAVIGAFIIGEYIEASVIIILFSISDRIEDFTLSKARESINKLMNLKPSKARLIEKGKTKEIPVEEVKPDSIILIRPTERIPVDGVIIEGKSEIDQSSITGESIPVTKGTQDSIYAGTLNLNSVIKVRVSKAFEDTVLKKIIYMVEQSASKKTNLEKFIDRFSKVYTPIIILLCTLIAIVPPIFFNGVWLDWIYKALTILLIGCPCAFVISTPVTIIGGISKASNYGILIKGGIYLEKFNEIKNIAFDKTGTLTHNEIKVNSVMSFNGLSKDKIYDIVYALEKHSEHPIAKAIVASKDELGYRTGEYNDKLKDYKILEGRGVEGIIDGDKYYLGSHNFIHNYGLCANDKTNHKLITEIEDKGNNVVVLGNDKEIIGAVSVSDKLRDNIKSEISKLKKKGIEKTIMLTGDNERVAKMIAYESGVDEYYSELLPEDKVKLIKKYSNIAMVGEGINDAPALANADLGISMGTATDVSIETSDIVLMEDDIRKLNILKDLSSKTLSLIKENIFLALGIKLIFLITAILGIADLWMAVVADVGASIIVILNGLRISRQEFE